MAVTHVALFNRATLGVIQMWTRSASDNAEDIAIKTDNPADLLVDGVAVATSIDVDALSACALDGPTADDVTAPPMTMEVDDPDAPTDCTYLDEALVGTRDGIYFEDVNPEDGLYPESP